MTTYNKATLKTYFETADVPTGTDYANLIDSQVNIVESSLQSMGGALYTPELITGRLSAGNANIVGTLSAASFASNTITATTFTATNATLTTVSGGVLNLVTQYKQTIASVSASGTTQGTAATVSAPTTLVTGVVNGAATGVILEGGKAGTIEYIINNTAVSGNIWPPTNGVINALATNAAYAMTGNSFNIVVHKTASTFAIK